MSSSVKARQYAVMGLLGMIMLAIGLIGFFGGQRSDQELERLYVEGVEPGNWLATIATSARDNGLAVDDALFIGDPAVLPETRAGMQKRREAVVAAWEAYSKVRKMPEEEEMAKDMWEKRNTFVKLNNRLLDLMEQGRSTKLEDSGSLKWPK